LAARQFCIAVLAAVLSPLLVIVGRVGAWWYHD
jgi:hypothetical protein